MWYLGRPLRLEVERGRKAQGTVEGDILRLAVPDPEDPGSRERAFGRAWDALCRREFEEVLEELYPLVAPFGVARPALRVRAMRSRWGSCSGAGNLSFSLYLMMADPEAVDYVVIHELAHRRQMNHSPAFWAVVEEYCPHWRACRERLRALARQLERQNWWGEQEESPSRQP